ncbi:MAG TPA: pyruvate kinase [Cytophagales bacterium]|nr:pyruvate kinase [Cytophagales bacterium]HAA22602.1 pyruvate kinase [Cytophagales bacterium]HAP63548.1 pyruvate kinase [Cytophagales bacterium]
MEHTIQYNRTKIVATVGPASNTKDMLHKLAHAGVDVFRLNFSHGSHDVHAQVIKYIRENNEEQGHTIPILQDLQGPKIRIGKVENDGVEITPGQELVITTEDMLGTSQKVSTTYTSLCEDVGAGESILVDDGKIELKVLRVQGREVVTQVVFGGILKSRKGINLPDTAISAPSLTDKDEKDLEFGLANDVEWVALSFVRDADDIRDLKDRIRRAGKDTKVVAKIEKPEAIANMDEIISVTDGLMVARGDLGVEIPSEDVPMHQKTLVRKCNEAGVPVIIATQMMESMIENPRPTRAETNDVANAVMDGADALMLSAETAAGKFPLEVIRSMVRTIGSIEENFEDIYNKWHEPSPESELFANDNVVLTAARLSDRVNAKVLVGMTQSGYTGFRLSSHRPKAHIFVFTHNSRLRTQLNLLWGVRCMHYVGAESTNDTFKELEDILCQKGFLHQGDTFIKTASMPFHGQGRTNMLKITTVE